MHPEQYFPIASQHVARRRQAAAHARVVRALRHPTRLPRAAAPWFQSAGFRLLETGLRMGVGPRAHHPGDVTLLRQTR